MPTGFEMVSVSGFGNSLVRVEFEREHRSYTFAVESTTQSDVCPLY